MSDIKTKVENIMKDVPLTKRNLAEEIFIEADSGRLSKLDAIILLEDYKLLPIGDNISDMPAFILKTFSVDYEGSKARSAVFMYSNELCGEYFKEDGIEPDDYTLHPDMTVEEGIGLIYDYVKEHRIIGTKIDW